MNFKINFSYITVILYGCLFLWSEMGCAATFTITNYRVDPINVEIHLNKHIGSKTLTATISGNGGYHKFNTGIYKVPRSGITFRDNKSFYFYRLPYVEISRATMLNGTIRLYRNNDYDYEFGSIKGLGRLAQE